MEDLKKLKIMKKAQLFSIYIYIIFLAEIYESKHIESLIVNLSDILRIEPKSIIQITELSVTKSVF
jgi:hypothetical protein